MQVGAMLTRRAVWETVGGFDPALRYGEDLDWFLRARERGISIAVSREVALIYRRHENNMTLDREMERHSLTYLLKLSLERRRRTGRKTPLQPVRADKTVERQLEDKLHGLGLARG